MEDNYFSDSPGEDYDPSGRIPPHSVNAERSVLGAMLISKTAAEIAADELRPEDFYIEKHQDIFESAQRLYNGGSPIDIVTVGDALEKSGKFRNVGGAAYISELSGYTPTAVNVEYYIGIIKSHSIKRKLLEIGSMLVNDAYNSEKDVRELLEAAERRIFEVAINRGAKDSLKHVEEAVVNSFRQISERMELKGALSGVPTGFSYLDKITGGFQKSDLIILAARPSMGKTALALNLATNAAMRSNKKVAIFSLEMSAEQLVTRVICSEAGVDMQSVRLGTLTEDDELIRIINVLDPITKSAIYIDDSSGVTPSEIRTKCRRLKARHGLDMIVIDYLQLMAGSGRRSDNRVQEISDITRSLKILARELDVPIILLSQLSRAPEKRPDKRPAASDLRDSGSIEQDADIIMMLYRPAYYGESDDNVTELIVCKNRNGPVDTVFLAWIEQFTKFTDSTAQYER